MIENNLWLLPLLFPVFFVAMWVFIVRIFSLRWSKLARRFEWEGPIPERATHFSGATMVIGRWPGAVSYRNAMHVWLDERGFFLRPLLLFRMFHPPLHIGWDSIEEVQPRKILQQTYQIRLVRDLPILTFGGTAGQALFDRWKAQRP